MEPYMYVPMGAGTGLLIGLGVVNVVKYYDRKDSLINDVIAGKELSFPEKEAVPYRSLVSRAYDLAMSSFDIGENLANKRYRAGKFDDIIESRKAGTGSRKPHKVIHMHKYRKARTH